ncbi:Required for respiratory growth protein 9 mitochondrial [Parahypoxylon ruwenzoriense]
MNCSCRVASLRIFIQSFTGLRLSNPAVAIPARQIQPVYPRISGYQSQHISRSYSATAALGFSEQTPRETNIHSTAASQALEAPQQSLFDNGPVNEHGAAALDISTIDLDNARQKGAIMDFSPESIDALVNSMNNEPTETFAPHGEDARPAADSNPSARSKPPVGSSKLKRRKILKEQSSEGGDNAFSSPPKEIWQIQKEALKKKFPEGWAPRKRLSPDALEGIRALHSQFPEHYTTSELANKFQVSPDAIRRILKSKWRANADEEIDRQERWFNRGKQIWSQMAALGKKPPQRWRREGIVRDPYWNRPKGLPTQPRRPLRPEEIP